MCVYAVPGTVCDGSLHSQWRGCKLVTLAASLPYADYYRQHPVHLHHHAHREGGLVHRPVTLCFYLLIQDKLITLNTDTVRHLQPRSG